MNSPAVSWVLAAIASLAAFSIPRTGRAEDPPQLAWVRQFDGQRTGGISGDGQQIYASVGARGDESFLQVFDFAGNPRWSYKDFKPAVDGYSSSSAADCWADGSGHVYWPVIHSDSVSDDDGTLFYKFDAAGAIAWQRRFPQYSSIGSISGDNDGHLYTTGGGTPGAFISKYAADGQEVWHRSEENGIEPGIALYGAADVVALPAGGVAVAGGNYHQATRESDVVVSKFDENGNLAWTREFGTAFQDHGNAVTADALGNIFVTGSQNTSSSDFSPSVAFLRKYSPDGDLLWNRQLGGADVYGYGETVAADAAGNVYVAAGTRARLAGPNAGGEDVFVRKYDPAGNIAWTFQFGTSRDDDCTEIWLDPRGNIVVGGRTSGQFAGPGTGSGNAFVALLAPNIAPGDFDFNGAVDGNDFLAWQQGNSPDPLSAADLAAWKQNFGPPGTVDGAAAVPEPASLSLLGIGCAAGLGGARTRRQSARQRSQPAPAPTLARPGGARLMNQTTPPSESPAPAQLVWVERCLEAPREKHAFHAGKLRGDGSARADRRSGFQTPVHGASSGGAEPAEDLAAWKQNFGPPETVDGAATVPEPNGLLLTATSLAAVLSAGRALADRRRAIFCGAIGSHHNLETPYRSKMASMLMTGKHSAIDWAINIPCTPGTHRAARRNQEPSSAACPLRCQPGMATASMEYGSTSQAARLI